MLPLLYLCFVSAFHFFPFGCVQWHPYSIAFCMKPMSFNSIHLVMATCLQLSFTKQAKNIAIFLLSALFCSLACFRVCLQNSYLRTLLAEQVSPYQSNVNKQVSSLTFKNRSNRIHIISSWNANKKRRKKESSGGAEARGREKGKTSILAEKWINKYENEYCFIDSWVGKKRACTRFDGFLMEVTEKSKLNENWGFM